jgi:hypothetical protein
MGMTGAEVGSYGVQRCWIGFARLNGASPDGESNKPSGAGMA